MSDSNSNSNSNSNKTYFVFESCRDNGYHLTLTESEKERDAIELFFREYFGDTLETTAVGEVVATGEYEAMYKVSRGEWDYSQD